MGGQVPSRSGQLLGPSEDSIGGMSKMDELVLGLPRAAVPGGLDWRGVTRGPLQPYLDAIAHHGGFRRRADAESDPTWKQVIPYVVLRDGDMLYLMRRTRAGGDARLHDLYSLGIGGHVNPGDHDIEAGMRREWEEEIDAEFEPEFTPLGLLNDDENAVGAVHLGFVYAADAKGRPVAIRERDKLEGRWATMAELGRDLSPARNLELAVVRLPGR